MSDSRLAAVVEDCVRAMRSGASREDCLRAYPELRGQLDLLLRGVRFLQPEPVVSFDGQLRVRHEVMASIRDQPRERRRAVLPLLPPMGLQWPSRNWRLAAAPAVALIVAVVIGFALVSPFGGAGPSHAGTVLTVLQGEVLVETADGIVPGRSGMQLKKNDRVITSADSRAVLTFFDGSTVTLEPDTALLINDVEEVDSQLKASLTQEKGRTWTHTAEDLGPADLKIETPNAAAQTTKGGSFETAVTGDRTEVFASTGAVSVQSGSNRTDVPGGSHSVVDPSGAVAQPALSPAAIRELVVQVRGADYVSLVDPAGATIGIVSPGVPVNQVPGATRTRQGDLTTIRIPEPADGAYRLSARSDRDAVIEVDAVVRNAGEDTPVASFKAGAQETWLVRFAVAADAIEPQAYARESKPDTSVVVPSSAADKAADKALTTTPTARASNTPTPTPTMTPTPTPTVRPAATPKAALTPLVESETNLTTDSVR